MNEWISIKDRVPESVYGTHRCLVIIGCNHESHQAVARNWPYPCGEVNIAYFWNGHWELSSRDELHPGTYVTHWMPLPSLPEVKDE